MAQYSLNRNQLLELALGLSGRVPDNQSPTVAQYSKSADFLNMVHADFMNVATPLIQLELKSTTATSSTITLEAEDDDVLIVYRNDSSGDDPPMVRLDYNGYYGGISDKTDSGEPTHYYVDYQSPRVIYLWPVPTSTTVKYLAIKKFDALLAATTIPLDTRYYSYLLYETAAMLCDFYQVDINRSAWLQKKANEKKADLKTREQNRFPSTKKGCY